MPFVLCDEHGGHAAPLVCTHLKDDVLNRRSIASVISVDAEHCNEPAWRVYLCPVCAAQHGIHEATALEGDEGLDAICEVDQHPVCRLCFDELTGPR